MRRERPVFRYQSRAGLGIFRFFGTTALDERRRVTPRDQKLIRDHLDWFNEHLPAPPVEAYVVTREMQLRGMRAITWYKPESTDLMRRTRELALVGHRYGHQLFLLRTREPGTLAYEDEFQIVARCCGVPALVMPVRAMSAKGDRRRVDRETIRRWQHSAEPIE
ncbi:MAG: hypothetical protein SFZ23_08490 [Planctomycetota bacterium]|nr:hypothetical protein [Planctomycetota bacterium]